MYLPVLGEIGTAGFGVEFEHSLPILVGGFSPDGFGSDDGRIISDLCTVTVLVDEMFSDDAEEAGAGGTPSNPSLTSLIFIFTLSIC